MLRIIIVVGLLTGIALSAPSSKIDGGLRKILESKDVASVVVSFSDTKEILKTVNNKKFASRGAKITFMKSELEAFAQTSQKTAIGILENCSFVYKSFWIANSIIIKNANEEIVNELAALPDVTRITEEKVAFIEKPTIVEPSNNTILLEWNIQKIDAIRAWALPGGNNGNGVVVSTIDTGVLRTHETLRHNHRSSYGWFDPYTATETPTDADGHGTMTMGILSGLGGIGVAPGSVWISCRGCDASSCEQSALLSCGEWITCPSLPNGESPDCSKAPVLVSNSWSTRNQGETWFDSVIDTWILADIVPIFPVGILGPSCSTVNYPGDNKNVIGVGSTTDNDVASVSSSRGPSVNGVIKPDVSAPGTNIKSAWNTGDTNYQTMSGTSFSAPHVSGLIALLLARNPNLTYDQVKSLVQDNTVRELGNATPCGGIPVNEFPNNVYGYGRINAYKSLNAAING